MGASQGTEKVLRQALLALATKRKLDPRRPGASISHCPLSMSERLSYLTCVLSSSCRPPPEDLLLEIENFPPHRSGRAGSCLGHTEGRLLYRLLYRSQQMANLIFLAFCILIQSAILCSGCSLLSWWWLSPWRRIASLGEKNKASGFQSEKRVLEVFRPSHLRPCAQSANLPPPPLSPHRRQFDGSTACRIGLHATYNVHAQSFVVRAGHGCPLAAGQFISLATTPQGKRKGQSFVTSRESVPSNQGQGRPGEHGGGFPAHPPYPRMRNYTHHRSIATHPLSTPHSLTWVARQRGGVGTGLGAWLLYASIAENDPGDFRTKQIQPHRAGCYGRL